MALFDECLTSFDGAFGRKQLRLTRRGAENPCRALADIGMVRIVFNNLLDNAASHAPAGSAVDVVFRRTADGCEVVFSNPAETFIEDPEILFEPLFRQEASRHDAEAHLGIGLTLSREAAMATGGTLMARRAAEDRIEFVLMLPAA